MKLVCIYECLSNNRLYLNIEKNNVILFQISRIKHKLNIQINDYI